MTTLGIVVLVYLFSQRHYISLFFHSLYLSPNLSLFFFSFSNSFTLLSTLLPSIVVYLAKSFHFFILFFHTHNICFQISMFLLPFNFFLTFSSFSLIHWNILTLDKSIFLSISHSPSKHHYLSLLSLFCLYSICHYSTNA